MVFEGQEKEEFWNHFPQGKEPYASDKRLAENQSSLSGIVDHPARLYEVSNATGRTTAIELPNFTQVKRKVECISDASNLGDADYVRDDTRASNQKRTDSKRKRIASFA